MTGDHPDAHELASALEAELRALAAEAPRELRMRLLVAAHAAGLLAREEASEGASDGVGVTTSEDAALAAAIRAGDQDDDISAVAARLRDEVAARLAIDSPGYGR